ncbi:hypothetical protein [Halorubrum sp. DTA46]|uniref:hypothetical protein n=1 Tax=Halorubrum sp. DTA46 TaxID=3402162 RepID=UPI003AAC2E65
MAGSEWIEAIKRQRVGVKIALALGGLVVIGLVIFGGLYAFGAFLFYDSYESSYNYETRVSVDGATEDLVLVAPVPVHNDEVDIGEINLYTYDDQVGDWEYAVIDTEHGPMLEIRISEITGADELVFESTVYSDRTIETKAPRGVEPVLSPMYDVEELDASFERRPDTKLYSLTSMAYAEHGGPGDVELSLVVRHEGANTWWTFGWSGNHYETYVTTFGATPDPAGEWFRLEGDHREGAGSYARFGPPLPQ